MGIPDYPIPPARRHVVPTTKQHLARPLHVLVPLIQEEIAAGNRAGLEHYRQAGELLLEVRDQVAAFKWTKWLKVNFGLSQSTAYDYMTLAERMREDPDFFRMSGKTLFEITRPEEHRRRKARRAAFKLHKPVDPFAAVRQARADEREAQRAMELQIIDRGYKALARELHPDTGGSPEAMARLNAARARLKQRL